MIGDWNAKVGSQETPGVTGKFGLGIWNEAGQSLTEFCQENALVIANTLFQQHKRRLYTRTSPDAQHRNQIDYIICSQKWRSSIQLAKTRLFKGLDLVEYLMNYGQRFMTLYKRQASRPSPWKRNAKKAKWLSGGGLTNSCEKKRSKKQRRKGKIQAFECRVPKNSKKR